MTLTSERGGKIMLMGGEAFPTRRAALAAAGGAFVLGLAGCSSYGQDAAAVVSAAPSNTAADEGDDAAAGEDGAEAGDDKAAAKSIAAVSKVPVGGGLILKKMVAFRLS